MKRLAELSSTKPLFDAARSDILGRWIRGRLEASTLVRAALTNPWAQTAMSSELAKIWRVEATACSSEASQRLVNINLVLPYHPLLEKLVPKVLRDVFTVYHDDLQRVSNTEIQARVAWSKGSPNIMSKLKALVFKSTTGGM